MRRRPGLGLIAAAAVIVAACGGDPATGTTTATTASTATTGVPVTAAPATAAGAPDLTGPTLPPETTIAYSVPSEAPTELVITDLRPGDGPAAAEGDTVEFKFLAVLIDGGQELANTFTEDRTVAYTIGRDQLIEGWTRGLVGVQEGMIRQIDVPAELAFGATGDGGVVPPDADLTFVFEIFAVTPFVAPTIPERADDADCPAADGSSPQQREFAEYPPFCIDLETTYTAEVVTNRGALTIELDASRAPLTVNSFVVLARSHYFDGTECHRAIPGFVVQCGDPTATGTGGPGYMIPDELPAAGEYVIGSVAMANAGPDTSGSQFFLITGPNGAALPPNYSLFGQVTEGLDTTLPILDALGNPTDNGVPPLDTITIESVTITES